MEAEAAPPFLQYITSNTLQKQTWLETRVKWFQERKVWTTKIAIIPRASYTHQSSSLSLIRNESFNDEYDDHVGVWANPQMDKDEKFSVTSTMLEPRDDFDTDPIELSVSKSKKGWFDEFEKQLDMEEEEDYEPYVVDG